MKHSTSNNVVDFKDVLLTWINGEVKLKCGDKLEEWYMNKLERIEKSGEVL